MTSSEVLSRSCDLIGMISDLVFIHIESVADRRIFTYLLSGNIMYYLIEVYWRNADSRCSGHSSGFLELYAPFLFLFLVFLHRGEVLRVERKFSDPEAAFPDSCLASRSSSGNSDWLYMRQQGFTPTLTVSVFLIAPCCSYTHLWSQPRLKKRTTYLPDHLPFLCQVQRLV